MPEIAPQITTTSLPEASKDVDYKCQPTASGTGTIEWRRRNIPDGMALSRQEVLSGTPTKAGEYGLKVTGSNDPEPEPEPEPAFFTGTS